MGNYTAIPFLTGIFVKCSVYDFEVRVRIIGLYSKLVDSILGESINVDTRHEVFKPLVAAIKYTIDYLVSCKVSGVCPDEGILQAIKSLAEFNNCVIRKIGLQKHGLTAFDKMWKQFTIDDISCDIGEFIIKFKETGDYKKREDILKGLAVLLADYNEVMNTSLTLTEVLKNSL